MSRVRNVLRVVTVSPSASCLEYLQPSVGGEARVGLVNCETTDENDDILVHHGDSVGGC